MISRRLTFVAAYIHLANFHTIKQLAQIHAVDHAARRNGRLPCIARYQLEITAQASAYLAIALLKASTNLPVRAAAFCFDGPVLLFVSTVLCFWTNAFCRTSES